MIRESDPASRVNKFVSFVIEVEFQQNLKIIPDAINKHE